MSYCHYIRINKIKIKYIQIEILKEFLTFNQVNTNYITCLYLHLRVMEKLNKESKAFKFVYENQQICFSEEMGEYVFRYVNMLFNKNAPDMIKNITQNFQLINVLKERYKRETDREYQKIPENKLRNAIVSSFTDIFQKDKFYKFEKKILRYTRKLILKKIPHRIQLSKEVIEERITKKLEYYKC